MDTYEQLKQILIPVVKSVFHFFKIHGKVILGNPSIIVQDMFSKRPESFNAIDVVLGSPVNQGLAVADRMVLAQPFQGVVATEGVRVVDRALPGFLSNHGHQFFLGNMLHNPRIDLAIALQQAKYDVFTLCSSTAHALAPAAKVGLIHFYLAIELTALKLGNMINGLSQLLVQAGNGLIIKTKIMSKAVGRLLLVETLNNGDLGPDLAQGFLFSTALVPATDIAARSLGYFERTAKHTLSTLQKVGRTTENVLSSLPHMEILTPHGYETH